MKTYKFLIVLGFSVLIFACSKENSKSTSNSPVLFDTDYNVSENAFQTGLTTTSLDNDVTALGRVLFYDDLLSINGSKSCASCHVQSMGFADGEILSDGFVNQKTKRHSMTIVNERANQQFFWDGRSHNLKSQVMMPVSDHIEMGTDDIELLIRKMEAQPYYAPLLVKAFGDDEISEDRISEALFQFVSSLASYNTKFDQVVRSEAAFTALEAEGQQLFQGKYKCGSCHGGNNFNYTSGGNDFANIGLDAENEDKGIGEGRIKVPSLRNVAITAPYMHDGRFGKLEDVINHYSKGIQENESLDWRLRDSTGTGAARFNIPLSDKKALIAFLNTLTDDVLLTDHKFSDPFK
jgi:cytochrome c peroxidase